MPRASYYTKLDNPIQLDRLPVEPTETAFRWPQAPGTVRMVISLAVLAIVCAADLVTWAVQEHQSEPAVRAALSFALAGGYLAFMAEFVQRFRNPWIRICVASLALWGTSTIFMTTFLDQPSRQCWLPAAFLVAAFIWMIGNHWTQYCTTTPVRRALRYRLLRRWRRLLMVVSSIPVAAAVIALNFGVQAAEGFLLICAAISAMRALVVFPRGVFSTWTTLDSWMTYGARAGCAPGMFYSPEGHFWRRNLLLVATTVIAAACLRDAFPYPVVVPALLVLFLPLALASSILAEAATHLGRRLSPAQWQGFIRDLQRSNSKEEQKNLFMGWLLDGSPLLLPFKVIQEHVHLLGGAGSGKTSSGLMPLIEQLIYMGDVSVVTIDLKGDTRELLATMDAAYREVSDNPNVQPPLKHFTLNRSLSTFAFNPQDQPGFEDLTSFEKTDLFAEATGLNYGLDFGRSFFTAANTGVMNEGYTDSPETKDFQQLKERIAYVLDRGTSRSELHPEMKKNGAHVHEVLKRLSAIAPLNVTSESDLPDDVIDCAIDLADVFQRPQSLYFQLPFSTSPGSGPNIARFVSFFLVAYASMTERKIPVVLVIDEFQRMASQNFETLLQLARSMGIGIVLANQSMEDLNTPSVDLRSTVETNCRFRRWFSVTSDEDRERVIKASGETVEYMTSHSESYGPNGMTVSTQKSEVIRPRINANEVARVSDHPQRSFAFLSRGAGYAQYSGLPFVLESDYHLTEKEYNDRRDFPWPTQATGTFIPRDNEGGSAGSLVRNPKPPGPTITTTVIGGSTERDDSALENYTPVGADQTTQSSSREGSRAHRGGRR